MYSSTLGGDSAVSVSKCTEQPRDRKSTNRSSIFCPVPGMVTMSALPEDRLTTYPAWLYVSRIIASSSLMLTMVGASWCLGGAIYCRRAAGGTFAMDLGPNEAWTHWVHAALVHDLSVHLVGAADAVSAARRVAADLGNRGFEWTLAHYTPTPPPAAQRAMDRAARKFFTAAQWSALQAHRGPRRPTISRDRRTLNHGPDPLVTDLRDAPAALAAWDLLHPGPTKHEIETQLLADGVESIKAVFGEHEWVAARVRNLRRAAAGLAVRQSAKRRKTADAGGPAQ